jgi:hypothetical protein
MPGLEPGIQHSLDRRVKPGDDGVGACVLKIRATVL